MTTPAQKKRVQALLVKKGFNLGRSGPLHNGVDGDDGQKTWDAIEQYLSTTTSNTPLPSSPSISHSSGVLINPMAFAKWAPAALPGSYEALEEAAQHYGLRGLPLIHWLGQMYVESAGFSTMTESLNYSVESLKKTFGRHRITEAECLQWGRTPTRKANQVAIANRVYGGQWGKEHLGNRLDHPNDGWDNRGSGFKQLTGWENISKSGYTAQELRTDVKKSAMAAAWYFVVLKPQCVIAAQADDVLAVTKAVNGGTNGLEDRKLRTQQARSVINA